MIWAARVGHHIARCIYPDQLLFLWLFNGLIFTLLSLVFGLLLPLPLTLTVVAVGLRIHRVESFSIWVFIRFLWSIIVLLILLWIIVRIVVARALTIVGVISLLIFFYHLTLLSKCSLKFFLIKFRILSLFLFTGLFLIHFLFFFFFLNFLHVF